MLLPPCAPSHVNSSCLHTGAARQPDNLRYTAKLKQSKSCTLPGYYLYFTFFHIFLQCCSYVMSSIAISPGSPPTTPTSSTLKCVKPAGRTLL